MTGAPGTLPPSTRSDTSEAGSEAGPTPERLLRRAAELRPRLIELQPDTEALTYYRPEIHDEFLAAGFYRTLVPKRYGGYEFPFSTFVRLLAELARGDMSAAWCMGLAAAHALQVGSYFGERAQAEIFGDGDFRAASVAAPTVLATRDGDGWVLDGKVSYCSGIPYSTHFVGQAINTGLPPEEAGGRLLMFAAPRSQWTMLDDWGDSLGLKGSGSQSIVFERARVPAHFVLEDTFMVEVDVSEGTPGLALHGNPLYGGRSLGAFTMTLAALMVGAGQGALDAYEEQVRGGTTFLPPIGPRIADPDNQRWYGAAIARLATAEAALLRCADEHLELCERAAAGGEPYGPEDEIRVSAIAREVCVQVWDTVDQCLVRTVGAGVMRQGTRFERFYRDLSVALAHRNTGLRDPLHRRLGQLRLGVG